MRKAIMAEGAAERRAAAQRSKREREERERLQHEAEAKRRRDAWEREVDQRAARAGKRSRGMPGSASEDARGILKRKCAGD